MDAVPAVNVVVPPAPSNPPTVKDAPTNVGVKMEQMESEEVVIVPNKKFKECVMYVLDHTNDEDEDDPKIAIVPITCKIEVEPRMQPRVQGTSLEAPAPPSASEIGPLAPGAASQPSTPAPGAAGLPSTLAPMAAAHPTVHPTLTVHGTVPPAGTASLPVGDVEEEKRKCCFFANQDDLKKKNQLKMMEVSLRLLRLLESPEDCNLPRHMFLETFVTLIILPWLNCCFLSMTLIQLMAGKSE